MAIPELGLKEAEDFFEEKTDRFTVDETGMISRSQPVVPLVPYVPSSTQLTQVSQVDRTKIRPPALPMDVQKIEPLTFLQPPKKLNFPIMAIKRRVHRASEAFSETGLTKLRQTSGPASLLIALAVASVLIVIGFQMMTSLPARRSAEHLDLRRPVLEVRGKFDSMSQLDAKFQELYQQP